MKRFAGFSLTATLLAIILVSPILGAGEGRVAGSVVDTDGNPLEGVEIIVSAVGYDFETARTTNKKGRFTLLLMDATKDYKIRFEKEGFLSIEEPLDPPLGDTLRQKWTMTPGQSEEGARKSSTHAGAEGPSTSAGTGQAGRKYAQGMEAFQQDDLATARTRFQEVIELQPDLPEAITALAMVMLRQESYQEALAESEKILGLKPDDVLALKIQYEAYRGMGNAEMEEALLDKLIVVSPDPDLARMAFNAAVAKIQAGDLAAGAQRFEQVRQMDPDLLPVYSALSRVYFDMEKYEECIAMANDYLAKDPDSGDVLGVLYLAYDRLDRKAEAEATFERLKGSDTTHIAKVMEEIGVSYFNNGDSEQAKEIFERILQMQPDNARAHYHLALCYAGLGDSAKAKELLVRFVELAPNDPDVALAQEMINSL